MTVSVHMTIKNIAKIILRPFITAFLRVSPLPVVTAVISMRPSMLDYLPGNRKFVFKKYLGDITVNVDTRYPIEKRLLSGSYEPETMAVIERFVREGDICFDIGANIGAVSFQLAKKCGRNGKVYAFEPGDIFFRRLEDNLALNRDHSQIIKARKIGFSDKRETLTWNEDKKNRGNAGFIIQQPNQEEKIELMTVDDLVIAEGIKRVDFIKIDVEGMELEVIKGAAGTIREHKPVLYYETGFFGKGFWAETERGEPVIKYIEDILKGFGYRFFKVEKGKIIETRYPDLSYNTISLAEDPSSYGL
jgi:FkbM family methyltransferase